MMTSMLMISISEWVYTIIVVGYAVTVLGIIGVVISENRNPVRSLAWVTVLLLLPLIGILLYAFFGRSLKSKHLISKKNKRKLLRHEHYQAIDENNLTLTSESIQQIRLARSLAGAHYFPGNKVKIYTSGSDKFNDFKKDLLAAKRYIHMQYYIFNNDVLGNEIADILIKKYKEGVKVRVIYDHVGSLNVKNRFFQRMRAEGVSVEPFLRVTFPMFATRINWRNHRKITIIDGEIGYIGGMNIADRYINGVNWGTWRDSHMRVVGPFIQGLQYSFAIDWNFMGHELLQETTKIYDVKDSDEAGIQLLTSGPNDQWNNISFLLLKAIANAKKCVYIQTPYFLPTESILKGLQSAALSKVDVKVMIPRKSDSIILTLATRSYITECLRAGVKIYFYEEGMLHAKTVVVDDEFSTIGSANFDFRSFEHNFEANAFIYSKTTNTRMKEIFMEDLKSCTRILPSQWRKRPLPIRWKESLVRLLSPVL